MRCRRRTVAVVVALGALWVVGPGVARAQAEAAPVPAPVKERLLGAPAPNPLVFTVPPPAPHPVQAAQGPPPKPRWVKPVTITLIVGAVAFAAASIAVISSGPTSDQSRVDVAAGLGGGFIACGLGGVIVGFVIH
jgi:hypothetical protein